MGKILEQDTEAYMLLRNRIFTLNDRHIAPEKLEGRAREREGGWNLHGLFNVQVLYDLIYIIFFKPLS